MRNLDRMQLEAFEFSPRRVAAPQAPPVGLGPRQLAQAVQANRVLARQLGWGCIVSGRVRAAPAVNRMLRPWGHLLAGLMHFDPDTAEASEEDFAQAVARWQQAELRHGPDGRVDARTWAEMVRRGALPRGTFERRSWPVMFRGRRLGILEKTAPYLRVATPQLGGAQLQVAFRATDMGAVRRAGFVTAAGEPYFRWIQVVEFVRQTDPPPRDPPVAFRFIRRAGRQVDPTRRTTPPVFQDLFPYYWDEIVMPAPLGDTVGEFHISHFTNRPTPNGLCYDLIFGDFASVPIGQLAADLPGRRDYNNYELALVGVRPPMPGGRTQNVILNTLRWGYDIFFEGGAPRVRLNRLQAGPWGGTQALRAVLGREAAGSFPDHCFVGSGYPPAARCP